MLHIEDEGKTGVVMKRNKYVGYMIDDNEFGVSSKYRSMLGTHSKNGMSVTPQQLKTG